MLKRLLDILLPCPCALCGMYGAAFVCQDCQNDYVDRARSRCPRCADPVEDAAVPCPRCIATPPAFDATVAAVDYAPPLDQIVLRLKFAADLPAAPWCGRMLAASVRARPALPLPDLLCPVPLSAARLRERGFNQALEIARPLAKHLDCPLLPRLIERRIDTQAQSSIAPDQRARNVRGAFALSEPAAWRVSGRHIGLVDDVMTSGHTLGELAAVLKRGGAARVTNFVFARTPPS